MTEQQRLHPVRVSFEDACLFVAAWHRHHEPPIGHKWSFGIATDDRVLRGVVIIGRPVARHFDDGQTLEVIRSATDGTPNANSALYGQAWRAAKAHLYTRLITYTQEGESGSSLKGAGFVVVAARPAKPGWDRPSRPRALKGTENVQRYLWETAGDEPASWDRMSLPEMAEAAPGVQGSLWEAAA